MRLHLLGTLVKWALSLGLLAGLLGGLFVLRERMQAERDEEETRPKAETPKLAAGIVRLEEDEAERYGLETAAAQAVAWYEQVVVYGRVIPNPRATVEVRVPFAGTLRAASGSPWPAPGQRVLAGRTFGWVDVRVGPEARLDLRNKLSDARIRQRGAEEEVRLQQSRVDSLKEVTSKQLFSRAELDAALIQLAQAKNQLATAQAAAELWQKALREVERHPGDKPSAWSQPLTAPADGEVTQLAGRPGMAVEAGALVVQLVDFRRPLIRLDVPPAVLARGGPPPEVEVRIPPALDGAAGPASGPSPGPALTARLAGPASQVDATSQLVSYWYDAQLPSSAGNAAVLWRPGMQVTARLRAAGATPRAAVEVPAEAVLYHEGRPLVYVRIGPEKYQRREARLLGREGDRRALAVQHGDLPVGVKPGECVVSRQAQILLSKEFLVGGADND